MKTLTIAALSSVAILMGASAGFAATAPVAPSAQHMVVSEATPATGTFQLAGSANSDFRCADALRTDGSSINPNINFCSTGA